MSSSLEYLFLKVNKAPFSEVIKTAPEVTGCYLMFVESTLVYVGRTTDQNLKVRLSQHYNRTLEEAKSYSERMIATHKESIKVSFKTVEDTEEIIETEKKWIAEHDPEWNRREG